MSETSEGLLPPLPLREGGPPFPAPDWPDDVVEGGATTRGGRELQAT